MTAWRGAALLVLVLAGAGCDLVFGVTAPTGGDRVDADPGLPGADGDPGRDSDGDGVNDAVDNCVATVNLAQADEDEDGAGDACDLCPHLEGPHTDDDDDLVGLGCDPSGATERWVLFEGFAPDVFFAPLTCQVGPPAATGWSCTYSNGAMAPGELFSSGGALRVLRTTAAGVAALVSVWWRVPMETEASTAVRVVGAVEAGEVGTSVGPAVMQLVAQVQTDADPEPEGFYLCGLVQPLNGPLRLELSAYEFGNMTPLLLFTEPFELADPVFQGVSHLVLDASAGGASCTIRGSAPGGVGRSGIKEVIGYGPHVGVRTAEADVAVRYLGLITGGP